MSKEEIERRLEKHLKDFKGVGGDVNALVPIPAAGVREILATLEAAVELLRRSDSAGEHHE